MFEYKGARICDTPVPGTTWRQLYVPLVLILVPLQKCFHFKVLQVKMALPRQR